MKKHYLYQTWQNMKQRCENPNNSDYSYYGERGISVCEEWKNSFDTFVLDMGDRPKGFTLDRIDNLKGYCKANCRWASHSEQMSNRRGFKHKYERNLEHKQKIRLALKGKYVGEKSPNFGSKRSTQTKLKMSDKAKDKTIYTFYHEIHGKIKTTRSELKTEFSLLDSGLSKLISGEYKSHKGWYL